MAEDHCSQDAPRMCANNCGFFSNPATNDLCSKCYRDLRLTEDLASAAKVAVEGSLVTSFKSLSVDPEAAVKEDAGKVVEEEPKPTGPSRCRECRKRVGLAGFKCRCGDLFCGAHRYSETHDCKVDFKTAGREEIARSNPIMKAEKLQKI